ncbi:sulfate transporter-like [Oppia nitens]|uniref:sulfate transporter-like n=1 Tax=Oppia nitens TaxID=1686743 RepID=UPI0023D98691|nr:sulfate transporter-like [Oppia nitens]
MTGNIVNYENYRKSSTGGSTAAAATTVVNGHKKAVHKQHSRISVELPSGETRVVINRDVVNYTDIDSKYNNTSTPTTPTTPNNNIIESFKHKSYKYLRKRWKRLSIADTLLPMFPIIRSARNYPFFRINPLVYDIVAGLTLATIQIPEAMANGYLSGMGPEYGLFVAFFPGLVYALMGTSHHTSLGTFSIMSIMIRDVVLRVGDTVYTIDTETGNHTLVSQVFSQVDIVTSLCLICGLIQLLMACLHLGSLSLLVSDTIANAFTVAASVQVLTLYFPTLFDIDLPKKPYSVFRIIKEWIGFFSNLHQINFITMGLSIACLTVLIVIGQVVQPLVNKKFNKFNIPFPTDILIVILSTLLSWLIGLNKNHQVDIVADIPNGIPSPKLPTLSLFSILIWDALLISLVSYAVSVSTAKAVANKHNYRIHCNQELLAIGMANTLSSLFNCYPGSTSLTRTGLLDRLAARSQLANLLASVILLFVILFFEPFIYHLPKCILSAIILVALKSMFMQCLRVKQIFRLSKMEGLIWLVTFIAVLVCDVDIGLLIAIVFNILVIVLKFSRPYSTVMGRLPNSELYVSLDRHTGAVDIRSIKIFYFGCALFFLNRHTFRKQLFKKVFKVACDDINLSPEPDNDTRVTCHIRTVIIDCSSIFYIDGSGMETLDEIIGNLRKLQIRVLLAAVQPRVLALLANTTTTTSTTTTTKYGGSGGGDGVNGRPIVDTGSMFVSVHDAVIKCMATTRHQQTSDV